LVPFAQKHCTENPPHATVGIGCSLVYSLFPTGGMVVGLQNLMNMSAAFTAFRLALAASIFALLSLVPVASAQKVFTVAGGYVGDGKPATSAAVGFPQFAAYDPQGELLISDGLNCRIRKVDAQGIISTIAGSGICGFSGDGGPATHAKISSPTGIAVDQAGNIFFVDQDNERVRQIDLTGTITTIAGNGSAKYCGDGKLAMKACLNFPMQLAVGNGPEGEVIYIADVSNQRIRRVVLSTGIITTVAGNGIAGYSGDGGLATQASLNFPYGVASYGKTHTLWISDSLNAAIRQVDLKTGIITTFLGDGTCAGLQLTLCNPIGLATDRAGNLYVADDSNSQVFKISVPGKTLSVEAGVFSAYGFNGDGIPATDALFDDVTQVLLDPAGHIVTVDAGNNRIRKGSGSNKITTIAGGYIGDRRLGPLTAFNSPNSFAADQLGNLYIADTFDQRIRKITPSGKVSTFAGNGFSGESGDGGPANKASLNAPFGVAADSSGNVYIADSSNFAIRKVDKSGTISTFAFVSLPLGMTTDAANNLYVADAVPDCVVWKITPYGRKSIVAGVQYNCGFNGDDILASQAYLNWPEAVALDPAGNLYLVDGRNNRVRMVDSGGIIHTITGNGNCAFGGDGGPASKALLCRPNGIAFDLQRNLYIADLGNARVRVVNTSGIINTFAGSGKYAFNGNGLPALKANMAPIAVATNPAGEIFILDVGNNRVRKVQ
jgi:sugar lactone lactonase YvrE